MESELNPYPSQQQRIDLSTGRSIVLYNVVIFVSDPHNKTLGLQYRTEVRSQLRTDRVADATALIEIYDGFSTSQGITRVTAQICNTEAAASMREPPEEFFSFSRAADGRWLLADV